MVTSPNDSKKSLKLDEKLQTNKHINQLEAAYPFISLIFS